MILMTGHGAGMLAADDQLTPGPISVSKRKEKDCDYRIGIANRSNA